MKKSILVTGVSGAGKTAASKKLSEMGYKAYDTDDLPGKLSAPALRALLNEKIDSLAKLAKRTEAEILELHGMGPASLPLLRAALKSKKLSFRK